MLHKVKVKTVFKAFFGFVTINQKIGLYTTLYSVDHESYMFRLCNTFIISLGFSEVRKEGNRTAVAIHWIIKLTEEISSLHKVFVQITFGENFYKM
jgi:hypothetical protein